MNREQMADALWDEPTDDSGGLSSDWDCEHDSRTGVDATPLSDPTKVYRCDTCGVVGAVR